ncbi:NAD(P)/FAD-dependent oxidoreductase [Xanthomonas sp. XNM01]|uniref:FAD-dependent oxidoreductase n=1 Tax=Xanthomonas sp. XNM01 TaxID=2769289 RepID=UPI00177BE51C|nr:NAD(P)/FAD-dependent oxidoreductase [Xanthomonas sp. XNM01]MBD9369768.1 FAD-dependent monooxygenase [Xanthomonas sp. XNM01]
MTPLRIAIVGYGSAGQAAALLLSRDGHAVSVFERVPSPGPVGAGFLLQPTGLQVLWKMGLLEQVLRHGAPVRRLYGDTPCGRAVMDMRYAGLDERLYGVGLQRGALFSLLDNAWAGRAQSLLAGHEIVSVDAQAGLLQDRDGRTHGPFDLVVVADGAASLLRGHVDTPRIDRPYPWGALWCLLPAGDWAHVDELRQRYVGARRMIGLLPVGGCPADPTRRLSFFWSLRTDRFADWEAQGLAPWREELHRLWPEAEAVFGGIADAAQLARARYRDTLMRRWHGGRVVLIGDAAHAMSPQLGQGVNMALMDADALAGALRTQPPAQALAVFQRERRAHVWIYQLWSRWLTPLFQSDGDLAAQLRDISFLPMGRVQPGRGQMLRVLTGTQRGVFGTLPLEPAFLEAMAAASSTPGAVQAAAPA